MPVAPENRREVGRDSVFVLPIGPNCQPQFVADTIESIRYFAPLARIIAVDDSRSGMGAELGGRYPLIVMQAQTRGVFGGLYLNLSDAFREALKMPFRILVRLDTDALIAGSDFEAKAIQRFDSDSRLGSLGSFRVGYDAVGVRSARWAKRQFLVYFAVRSWAAPNSVKFVVRTLARARKSGYQLGDSVMGGASVYRYEAVEALDQSHLLGRSELAAIGLQEDYIFGLCLYAAGYHLGEFGNRYDDLPMGVNWRSLPAAPSELMERGKSIIHSTKRFGTMDERAIREEFRSRREER